jgi:hypothetical protein
MTEYLIKFDDEWISRDLTEEVFVADAEAARLARFVSGLTGPRSGAIADESCPTAPVGSGHCRS